MRRAAFIYKYYKTKQKRQQLKLAQPAQLLEAGSLTGFAQGDNTNSRPKCKEFLLVTGLQAILHCRSRASKHKTDFPQEKPVPLRKLRLKILLPLNPPPASTWLLPAWPTLNMQLLRPLKRFYSIPGPCSAFAHSWNKKACFAARAQCVPWAKMAPWRMHYGGAACTTFEFCFPYTAPPTYTLACSYFAIFAHAETMSSPGVEPGLSRPQRDVPTTRR